MLKCILYISEVLVNDREKHSGIQHLVYSCTPKLLPPRKYPGITAASKQGEGRKLYSLSIMYIYSINLFLWSSNSSSNAYYLLELQNSACYCFWSLSCLRMVFRKQTYNLWILELLLLGSFCLLGQHYSHFFQRSPRHLKTKPLGSVP